MINWRVEIIKNFQLREVRCHGYHNSVEHDCGLVILVQELLLCVDKFRTHWDGPIRAGSWTRCDEWNAIVGGVADSYHKNGHALDPRPALGSDMDEFEELARQCFPFVLRYSTFLHCDIRGERPEVR